MKQFDTLIDAEKKRKLHYLHIKTRNQKLMLVLLKDKMNWRKMILTDIKM